MTKMPGEFKYKKKVIALASLSFTLTASYLALFGMTIINTYEYQKSEKAISATTAELSRIEFAYLSSEAKINANLASTLGFVEPKNIVIARGEFVSETAFLGNR
jgi:hypothetical protein